MLRRAFFVGLLMLIGIAFVAYCETPPSSTPSTTSTPAVKGKQAAPATKTQATTTSQTEAAKTEATKTQTWAKPATPATPQQMGMPQGYQPDEDWTYFVGEPQNHFQMAREQAAKKDMKAASMELHKSAAFMRLEAMRVDMESKQAIQTSAKDIDALADRVQQGASGAANEMDQAFAHANQVLAQSHYKMATEAYAKNETKAAGRELQAADMDIDNGMKWMGKTWTETTAATKMTVRQVANDMASDAKVAQDDAKRAMDATGRGIESLAKDLQDYGKRAQTPSKETSPKVDPPGGK